MSDDGSALPVTKRLGALAVVALLVTSCVGARRAENAEHNAIPREAIEEQSPRSTRISDSWVTAKTKIALYADERVKGRQVNVDTHQRVVTLRGTVDSLDAREVAEAIAWSINGVKAVSNYLRVTPPAERAKRFEPTDEEISGQVKESLFNDGWLKTSKIDVHVKGGVAMLSGEALNISASARASEIAREVPGVRAVKNDLLVKSEQSGDFQ